MVDSGHVRSGRDISDGLCREQNGRFGTQTLIRRFYSLDRE